MIFLRNTSCILNYIRNIALRFSVTKIKHATVMEQIKFVENELVNRGDFPEISAGDTVTVHYKIKEGNKERTQLFKGVVIQRKGKKGLKHLPFAKCLAVLV